MLLPLTPFVGLMGFALKTATVFSRATVSATVWSNDGNTDSDGDSDGDSSSDGDEDADGGDDSPMETLKAVEDLEDVEEDGSDS